MPQVFTGDHATHGFFEQNPPAIGVPILPASAPDSSNSTSDETPGDDPNTEFAYEANPTSDTAFCTPAYATDSANNTQDAHTRTGASESLARTANADIIPNLNFDSSGVQLWPALTPSSYIEPAHRATYDFASELFERTATAFEKFDDPAKYRPVWNTAVGSSSEAFEDDGKVARPGALLSGVSKDGQLQPKSALKRNLQQEAYDHPNHVTPQGTVPQRPQKIRRVSFEQMSATGPGSADDEDSSASETPVAGKSFSRGSHGGGLRRGRGSRPANTSAQHSISQAVQSARQPPAPTAARGSKTPTGHPPSILPPEKVFPIQIGSELFRLSGASISSDAPSYFTNFFEEQIRQNEESPGIRPLYIDRDPETFRDIVRHLQGYYIKPRDGSHFVKLFADAQFYSLPRLIDQLFESEIFIQIGQQHFQIPKDIFSDPGNSPNFFSLGFAVFFSSPGEVFPGLDRRGLLRPPSITPPYVPGRSAETFAQLIHMLRGYPLHISNETHRAELLRDCRYFHLRGLEQKLIAYDISYNLERQQNEICLRIEDVKPSGISYKAEEAENEQDINGGWVRYARPFVDDDSFELVVEIGGETTSLDLDDMRLDFHGLAKARVSSLLQVIANKMNLPTNAPLGAMLLSGLGSSSHASPGHTPLSEDRVKTRFESASDVLLNSTSYEIDWNSPLGKCMSNGPSRSPIPSDDSDAMSEDEPTRTVAPQRPRVRAGQRLQGRSDESQDTSVRSHAEAPPRLETSTNTSRKRRRPTISTSSNNNGHGTWVIRNGQWRLRVQQSEQDPIRGGYEIVFMAVKVDAFSQERARNARRSFLGSGS